MSEQITTVREGIERLRRQAATGKGVMLKPKDLLSMADSLEQLLRDCPEKMATVDEGLNQ